ncbi:exonuclease [Enterobacter sp. RHBSTW-00175]|uniref:exonuclease n=1 Tax=Enterobacter sp. RHBSTW-00175 TaxID=2742639 RepID=UPI0015E95401|nr:exonuclease [Enterobacter sp. RHBSTW-00175]QMR77716.1 3'-5' exoribonuclease [Enterobacter sp. RHBSTW-00175]
MEFFHLIKATQKSGKPDAIFWQSQKTEARASLALDVALEDAEIETGRGHDYLKPVRTDFPVFNDLPEESIIDFEWCKRYELGEDNRTWYPIIKSEPEGENKQANNLHSGAGNSSTEKPALLRPVSRLRLPQRLIAHLINDTEEKEISEERHIQIGQMENDDSNQYVQNLLLAAAKVPDIKELSAHVEWNLVSAIKQVFQRDQVYTVGSLEEFMTEWVSAPETRTTTVHKWLFDKEPEVVVKDESIPSTTTPVLITVATLPLRQRILAQFISDEYAYHVDAEQKKAIQELEMDVDNSYVQNLLLAAENVEFFKNASEIDIFRVVAALKTVFPVEGKRTELSLVMRFIRIWFSTEHIDRGILIREWAAGNRISNVQRTDSGTNAGGGNKTDRNPELKHDLDALDLEIALATLSGDFNIYDIPGAPYRLAKDIVSAKDSPFKEWSAALRNVPGILDYSRAAIFALIRNAHPSYYLNAARLSGYINANLTESNHENPKEETLVAARHAPEVSWENEINQQVAAEKAEVAYGGSTQGAANEPQVENLGGGVFSIDGLMNEKQPENDDRSPVNEETTSDVQIEKTGSNETPDSAPLSKGSAEIIASTSSTETDCSSVAERTQSDLNESYSVERLYTHLMVDIEAFGKKPDSPVVSIGAVFFDPATGNTGSEFYKIISLESSMAWGGIPDASTIIYWLRASPEARSELVMDDAIPLDDALLQLNEFITENAVDGAESVQVWGNGATYDNVLLAESYGRTGIPCPWKFWNNRDVRTIVELGKAVGYTPRYEIPFVGEPHKAISDARHQVKYVSAIWQRLISN